MNRQYTIGIDFGSLSGRAVLMNVNTGEILATSVYEYPHAVMTERLPDGTVLGDNVALQHPMDYLEVRSHVVPQVLSLSEVDSSQVVGVGIDFTACTMLPVDETFQPLCFQSGYQSEPHAYVKLWKHHAAQQDADLLTQVAVERNETWLKRYGGKISSEWMLPKILETLEFH